MSKTAEAIATGPFHGFFHEGATLYRLDPPVVAGGYNKWLGVESEEVEYVVVSGMEGNDDYGWGPETAIFAADEFGVVDGMFYLKFGCIIELGDVNDPAAALARLGYDA